MEEKLNTNVKAKWCCAVGVRISVPFFTHDYDV